LSITIITSWGFYRACSNRIRGLVLKALWHVASGLYARAVYRLSNHQAMRQAQ